MKRFPLNTKFENKAVGIFIKRLNQAGREPYFYIETSPPSAREAAMSAMQHETFIETPFLETSLKHSGNTLENHEISMTLPIP